MTLLTYISLRLTKYQIIEPDKSTDIFEAFENKLFLPENVQTLELSTIINAQHN